MSFTDLNSIANEYVRLGLHFHLHDRNPYIYLGPEQLRAEVRANPMALDEVFSRLQVLEDAIQQSVDHGDDLSALRKKLLTQRILEMVARAKLLRGNIPSSFEQEVEELYSVRVARLPDSHFKEIAFKLNDVISGAGPLPQRLAIYRDQFKVPPERLHHVMTTVVAEARSRTRSHIQLPDHESVSVNIVHEGPFVGFADYKGDGKTVVHLNASVPIHVERVIELATHEAYPGHHVQATLIDAEIIKKRSWFEYTLNPLFGAQTVMLEGAANYGIHLAFERNDRIAYDREVVWPLAGLGHLSSELERYHHFVDLVENLNFARNEAARHFLYDGWSKTAVIDWLVEYGLETQETAEQRLRFIEALRSYVITYNYGLIWATSAIHRGQACSSATQWSRLREMLTTPLVPSLNSIH